MKNLILIIATLFFIIGFSYEPVKESVTEYWESRPKPTQKPVYKPTPTKRPTPKRVYKPAPTPQPYIKLTFPFSYYAVSKGRPVVIKWESNISDRYFQIYAGGRKSFDNKTTWIRLATVFGTRRQYEWHVPERFPFRQMNLVIGITDDNGKWITTSRASLFVR